MAHLVAGVCFVVLGIFGMFFTDIPAAGGIMLIFGAAYFLITLVAKRRKEHF
jgi:ABC-type Mn2+/Zn2+ transport system permease subunit